MVSTVDVCNLRPLRKNFAVIAYFLARACIDLNKDDLQFKNSAHLRMISEKSLCPKKVPRCTRWPAI